ncbi:MAG: NAD(P)/FAD-dependent oxidoreductase [bacterium]
MKTWDIIVIGAGPAGSACASLCAKAGRSVLLLEAARFPRDKVCGDCLNPSVWPVIELLGLRTRIDSLPSSSPKVIRFSVAGHGQIDLPMPQRENSRSERVIRRLELDALLVERAIELGVLFRDGSPVTSLRPVSGLWEVTTTLGENHHAHRIVAADGRNSVTARHLRMHSSLFRDSRIGIQTHIPHPADYDGALEMRIYRNGYGGLADLGNGMANLCLVANDGSLKALRKEAEEYYRMESATAWRSITSISRPVARHLAKQGVFLCGDAARVVEPFTGEGIAFALRSAELLADHLIAPSNEAPGSAIHREVLYSRAHRELYGKGLWVNRLTRFLSEHPRIAHRIAPLLLRHPRFLSIMTRKVITTQGATPPC